MHQAGAAARLRIVPSAMARENISSTAPFATVKGGGMNNAQPATAPDMKRSDRSFHRLYFGFTFE